METIKRLFRVDPRDIGYLSMIIESYDGMAVVRTIDPKTAVIEIQIAPGCQGLVFELLNTLAKDEAMSLAELEVGQGWQI